MNISRRPRRKAIHVFLATVAALFIVGLGPVSASAAVLPAATSVTSLSGTVSMAAPDVNKDDKPDLTRCPDQSDSCPLTPLSEGSDSDLIPLNRWSDSITDIHFRIPSGELFGATAAQLKISTLGALMSVTVGLWSGTAWLSELATSMDPINEVGATIDASAAKLGSVITTNPLIFTLVGVVLILGAFWNKSRGRDATGLFKRAASVFAIFIILGVMTLGAGQTAQLTANAPNQDFTPGVASPGWMVTMVQQIIGDATNAALGGVNSSVFSAVPMTGGAAPLAGELSCTRYVSNMKALYTAAKSDGASVAAMSSMWETTALSTWAAAQFGANNPYVENVWCHRADVNAGMLKRDQVNLTLTGVAGETKLRETGNWDSKAWHAKGEVNEDRTMFAWAACNWDGTQWFVHPAFQTRDAGTWVEAKNCKAWWEEGQGINLENHMFNVGTGEQGQDTLEETTDDRGVRDFASSWQGTNTGLGATTTLFWSIIASLVIFVILGLGLSGAVAAAKVMTVVVMMTLMLSLVASLFMKEGSGPRIAKVFKQLLGFSFLSAGAGALFLVFTWMTQLLISIGANMAAPGSILVLIWTAISPILSVILLHQLFKKMNVPNPMTPRGAMAWGAGAGAAGGAIGAGLVNKFANKGKNALGKAVDDKMGGAIHKMSGGKFGKVRNGASLGGEPKPGAGAPPKAPAKNAGPELSAEEQELKDAREFAKAPRGGGIPLSGLQRADGAVRAAAGGVRSAAGLAFTKEGRSNAQAFVSTKIAGASLAATAAAESVRNGASAVGHNVRQMPELARFVGRTAMTKEGRATMRELSAENFKSSPLGVLAANGRKNLVNQAHTFAANPVTQTWKATQAVGRVVGATARVGAKTAGYTTAAAFAVPTFGLSVGVAAFAARGDIKKGNVKRAVRRDADDVAAVAALRTHRAQPASPTGSESSVSDSQARAARMPDPT